MDTFEIKAEIRELLSKANPRVSIHDDQEDLFALDTRVTPGDMLFTCMELKKKYPIDYNQVADQVEVYTLNNLAAAICEQLK